MGSFYMCEVCVTWDYSIFCSPAYSMAPVCGSWMHKIYTGGTPSVTVLSLKDFVTVRAGDSAQPHDAGESYDLA